MEKFAVQCHQITKTFHMGTTTIKALNAIDLTIQTGEFMMLMGPSGCGKTTLMSVIAGILHSDEGSCQVLHTHYQNSSDETIAQFRSKHIGFIFQSFNLIPTLTVAENVAIPLMIGNMPRNESLAQADETLKQVGLTGYSDANPNALSGGQQQRIAIARALAHKPDLVLCDEPTSALDLHTGLNILDLMKNMNRSLGTTFLIITHDQRIAHYADRIAHMDDGCITHIEVPHAHAT